jgi:hypothetical protein
VVVGGGLLGFLSLLLMAYCVLDLVTSPAKDVRGLPKPLWVPVLLVPLFGAAFWFLLGRPRPGTARSMPKVLPDAPGPGTAPDDDEAFLRDLRRRTQEQRRRADEQRRRDEGDRPG